MNKHTRVAAVSLGLLLAGSAACAQPATGTGCDTKKDKDCVNKSIVKSTQAMITTAQACGPAAGCGNPSPVSRAMLTPEKRAELARAIAVLYLGTNVTAKDVEIQTQQLGLR